MEIQEEFCIFDKAFVKANNWCPRQILFPRISTKHKLVVPSNLTLAAQPTSLSSVTSGVTQIMTDSHSVSEVKQTFIKEIKTKTLKCVQINLTCCFYLKITDVVKM